MLGNSTFFSLIVRITQVLLMEMDGFAFDEKRSFKMLGLPFSSKLDWDSYIVSIP